MIDRKDIIFLDVDFFSKDGDVLVPDMKTQLEFVIELNNIIGNKENAVVVLVGTNKVIQRYRYNNKQNFNSLKNELSTFGFGDSLHEVLYIEKTTDGLCKATNLWEGCCNWLRSVSLPEDLHSVFLMSPKVLMDWENFKGGVKE